MEDKEKIDIEQTVNFKIMSDLTVLAVKSPETEESLFEITGYGIKVNLNREKINSFKDVEDLVEGIASMYRKMILKELLPDEKNS